MSMAPDPAFSDAPLDKAATEAIGMMSDHQGIAPTDHNSGNLAFIGPVDHGAMPGNHNSEGIFGGGYSPT
jgi:hypothetical protein